MKRHLPMILLAATALASSAAVAAPVFMLQFGSYETREEADSSLATLKNKHAGVLSRLEAGVREVKLPPDNLTVYRTTAGPLATRADAQSVCSQLASNGDTCYVMETAIMQPALPPVQQVAKTEPAPAPVPTPAPAAAKEVAKAPEPAMPPLPVPTPAPKPVAAVALAPAPKVAAAAAAPAPVSVLTPTSGLPSPGQSVMIPTITPRDPNNVAAISRVSAPAAVPAVAAVAASAPAVPVPAPVAQTQMDRDLADAAARQKANNFKPQPMPFASTAVGVSPATTSTDISDADKKLADTKQRSLWDRMFGDDEDEAEAKPAPKAPVKDYVTAAPVEPTSSVPLPALTPLATPAPVVSVAPPVPAAPVAVQAAPAPALVPPAPLVSREPAPAPVAPLVASAPIVKEATPFVLPPPPLPLKAETRAALEQAPMVAPAPLPVAAQTNMPAPAPVIAPVGAAPVPVPAAPPQQLGVPIDAGNVKVEEAKRVPLSEATVPAPLPPAAVTPALPPEMSPTATIGQKTLWAELGSFADAQGALAFWDKFRRQNPDFPVVRVRVTSPVLVQTHGIKKVNLRIGPFASSGFIENLCDGDLVDDEGLRCGEVTDMGVANAYGESRGVLPSSRYSH